MLLHRQVERVSIPRMDLGHLQGRAIRHILARRVGSISVTRVIPMLHTNLRRLPCLVSMACFRNSFQLFYDIFVDCLDPYCCRTITLESGTVTRDIDRARRYEWWREGTSVSLVSSIHIPDCLRQVMNTGLQQRPISQQNVSLSTNNELMRRMQICCLWRRAKSRERVGL